MATTTTVESLPSDLIAAILRRMDGPTLAAFSSSSSLLRGLSSSEASLWAHHCLSTWPSLRHLHSLIDVVDHRRFFLDSFPFPANRDDHSTTDEVGVLPSRLVSAVDLYHKGTPIFTRVIDTDASAAGFLDLALCIYALEWEESERMKTAPERVIDPAELTLSWVVMDPESGRAVNVSSRRPVDIDVQCCSGETMVRFAMVLGGCVVGVVVTCREEDGHVMEVGLTVEDVDGRGLSWRESLRLLKMAMEGERTTRVANVSSSYEELLKERRARRETRARRDGLLDLSCTLFGSLMFLTFVLMLLVRS